MTKKEELVKSLEELRKELENYTDETYSSLYQSICNLSNILTITPDTKE